MEDLDDKLEEFKSWHEDLMAWERFQDELERIRGENFWDDRLEFEDKKLPLPQEASTQSLPTPHAYSSWTEQNSLLSKKDKDMAAPNLLGKAGEDAAAAYLQKKGYIICDRNWRMNHLELDIIATKDDVLVFVEVKTRKNTEYREPYEAVDWKKIRHIVMAADTYIKLHDFDGAVRFDIVTVVGKEGNFEIQHIEDAFDSPIF